MTISNWIYIASILASIISVYISYVLGQKASNREFEQNQKMKRYDSLYAPLMQLLYHQPPDKYAFYNLLVFNQFEPFEKLLVGNVQYMGKESAKMLYRIITTGKSEVIKQNEKNISLLRQGMHLEPMDNKVSEAIDLYRELLVHLLSESVALSQSLNLEPIGQPLIHVLQEQDQHLNK